MRVPHEVWCSDFGGDVGGSWRTSRNAAHPILYLAADLTCGECAKRFGMTPCKAATYPVFREEHDPACMAFVPRKETP